MKKRIAIALTGTLVLTLVWFSLGVWQATRVPSTVESASNHLHRDPLAYTVIDGTPLVLAEFGGTIFLDTLRLDFFSMEFPPYPRWQWTGDWERIRTTDAVASADLSAHFGPLVIFGLVNDERIVAIEILRDGTMVQTIPISAPAYIVQVDNVLLTDEVRFITDEGEGVSTVGLMGG